MADHGWASFRTIASARILVFAVAVSAGAEGLSMALHTEEAETLSIDGLNFLATIDGEISFIGGVTNSENTVWISARRGLTGTAFYRILDLTTCGWILMTAAGKAEEEVLLASTIPPEPERGRPNDRGRVRPHSGSIL